MSTKSAVKRMGYCWWCSKQLRSWKGWNARVDGNEVAFHKECLGAALHDEDLGDRIEASETFEARS